jgi:plastocyanin
MRTSLIAVLSAGAIAVAVAGCGGSSSSSSTAAAAASPATSSAAASSAGTATASSAPSSASSHLAIAANSSGMLMFDRTSLTAKAGRVTITFTNHAPEGHNFTIKSPSGATVAATPTFSGGAKTLAVTLKPGHYTFLCTVSGHAMAGMQGTLTVS